MLPSLRRLLVALLIAVPGIVLIQTSAHAACSCADRTLRENTERAEVVFSGVLVDKSTDRDARAKLDVKADRVYKGTLSLAEVRVVTDGDRCGLADLKSDEKYVFFASLERGKLTADQCGGTDEASQDFTDRVVNLLGEGTSVGKPPAEERPAKFTLVDGAEPEEFTRLAAPGGALVLLGLLGLLVVRRRASRG